MTATEELRALLDERGVEWSATVGASGTIWTHWDAFNGHRVHAMDNEDGTVEIFGEWDVTPEQAIAATLGVGTCHDVGDPGDFCCSECGVRMFTESNDTYTMIAADERTIIKHPNFCPNCGARVEDE